MPMEIVVLMYDRHKALDHIYITNMDLVSDTLKKYGLSKVFDVIVSLICLYQSCCLYPLFMILTSETCMRDENNPELAVDTTVVSMEFFCKMVDYNLMIILIN
jgi:hypothetical protein